MKNDKLDFDKIYAENLNFWKTSKSSPDSWLEKAAQQIKGLGGKVLSSGGANNFETGVSIYIIRFKLDNDVFRIVWPCLESSTGDHKAARIQAATMLYHDVKNKTLNAVVFGSRIAFLQYLELANGATVGELSDDQLLTASRDLFGTRQLPEG